MNETKLYAHSMEVHLSPDLQAKLNRVATEQGRDSQTIIQEAVERLLNYNEWFIGKLEKGLGAGDRGEFIDHEEIGKRIQSGYPG